MFLEGELSIRLGSGIIGIAQTFSRWNLLAGSLSVFNWKETKQEWLNLQKEVREFLKTAAEEDRKLIGGYTESLCMICSAIKEGLL